MSEITVLLNAVRQSGISIIEIEDFFVLSGVDDIEKKDIDNFRLAAQKIMNAVKNIQDPQIKKNIEILMQSHIKKNIDFFKQQKNT